MNRNVLIIILLPLYLLTSCSKEEVASNQAQSFIKFFGNSRITSGNDVKQLPDGTFIVLGTTLTDNSKTDVCLIKADKYGNEIWQKTFGIDSLAESGKSMQVLPDGSFILVGNVTTAKSIKNIFLVKASSSGELLWAQNIGGDSTLTANSIYLNKDGSIAVAGTKTVAGSTNTDGLLLLVDNNGNELIQKYLPTSGNDAFYSIAENTTYQVLFGTSNNKCIASIFTKSSTFPYSSHDLPFNGSAGQSVKPLSDGSFVGVGTSASSDSANQILLVKFKIDNNFNLVQIWEKKLGTINNDRGVDIEVVSDNEFAVVGTTTYSDGSEDIIFVKTDGTGNQLGEFVIYGATGNQTGEGLAGTADGGFVLTGTNEYTGNSVLTLIKTINDGNLNEE